MGARRAHAATERRPVHGLRLDFERFIFGRAASHRLGLEPRNRPGPIEVHRQDFEQHVYHRFIGLVENCMIDIAGFEEEIAWLVDDCLVRRT